MTVRLFDVQAGFGGLEPGNRDMVSAEDLLVVGIHFFFVPRFCIFRPGSNSPAVRQCIPLSTPKL